MYLHLFLFRENLRLLIDMFDLFRQLVVRWHLGLLYAYAVLQFLLGIFLQLLITNTEDRKCPNLAIFQHNTHKKALTSIRFRVPAERNPPNSTYLNIPQESFWHSLRFYWVNSIVYTSLVQFIIYTQRRVDALHY